MNKPKIPIRPKQRKMRTDPEAETTQGENAESQSQPKKGVATTTSELYRVIFSLVPPDFSTKKKTQQL